MTEQDWLLVRLEQVNPVPEPTRLYTDPPETLRAESPGENETSSAPLPGPPIRRGLFVTGAVAALVIVVGLGLGLVASDLYRLVAGTRPLLQLTIYGDTCVYEGPRALAHGEVEIVYRNTNPEVRWANTLRLDDGRTVADALSYTADDPLAGPPQWSSPVWLALNVAADGEPSSLVTSLEPGTHLLLCGDASRGAVFGAEIVVTE